MRELTEAEYKEAQDYERSAFVVPLEQFLSVEKELNEARVLLSEKTIQYEITQEELEFVKHIRCDAITIEADRLAEEFKRNTLPDDVKLDILFGFTRKLEHALDELQEKYDTLAVENMLEVNEICKQRDAAIDALMAIEDIFIDGDDTYEDWKSMGQIARTFLEKTYESGINQNN
jgi:hypothetical protein